MVPEGPSRSFAQTPQNNVLLTSTVFGGEFGMFLAPQTEQHGARGCSGHTCKPGGAHAGTVGSVRSPHQPLLPRAKLLGLGAKLESEEALVPSHSRSTGSWLTTGQCLWRECSSLTPAVRLPSR